MRPTRNAVICEFYETDELGGQIDNWCGPTTQCLIALARSAGFPRLDLKYVDSRRAGLVAYRHWNDIAPEAGRTAPFLCSAVNNRHNDIVFQPGKDEYVCLAFLHEGPLKKEDLRIEIDRFGVPALVSVRHEGGYWQANAKVPPGVGPGDHEVRIGIAGFGWSDKVLDSNAAARRRAAIRRNALCRCRDQVAPPVFTRIENTMDRSTTFRGYRNETLACRFSHHDGPLDLAKVQLTVDGLPWPLLSVERPAPGMWQVNARLQRPIRGQTRNTAPDRRAADSRSRV